MLNALCHGSEGGGAVSRRSRSDGFGQAIPTSVPMVDELRIFAAVRQAPVTPARELPLGA